MDTRNPPSKLTLTILAGGVTWELEIMLEGQRGLARSSVYRMLDARGVGSF